MVGEQSAGEGAGIYENQKSGDGTDDSGLVSGHPTESGGSFGFFHTEGLTDKGTGGDGESEAGHECKSFDTESGADGGDGRFSLRDVFENCEKHKERCDPDNGHESGRGGDPEDPFGPIEAGESDSPGFTERGSGDENEINDGRNPTRYYERPRGSGEAKVCTVDCDVAEGASRED